MYSFFYENPSSSGAASFTWFFFVPPHDSWKVLCHWWLNKVLTSACILNPHIPKGHISRWSLTKPHEGSYKRTFKLNIFVKEHSGALHSKRAQENLEANCITEIASINLLPSSIKLGCLWEERPLEGSHGLMCFVWTTFLLETSTCSQLTASAPGHGEEWVMIPVTFTVQCFRN